MDLHIVHGNMVMDDGRLDPEFKQRIRTACSLIKPSDVLILAGGVTKKGYPAESVAGYEYFKEHLAETRIQALILENRSKTTGENILFSLMIVLNDKIQANRTFVYHRKSSMLKTMILYWQLWKAETKFTFIAGIDTSSLLTKFRDQTVMVLFALFDPAEKGLLWRVYKKNFRNPSAEA